MTPTSANSELEVVYRPGPALPAAGDNSFRDSSFEDAVIARVRLLWAHRMPLIRAAVAGLLLATLIAFTLPKRFESTTRLMPPDGQSNQALALAALTGGGTGANLGMLAGNLLGVKSSGDLFIGILVSRTVEDDLVSKFDLQKVYRSATMDGARRRLAGNTAISEDHKSGIITITVTDQDPKRAAAMALEYVTELNAVVNRLSTSSARREREFLEDRLAQVKQDLETAEKEFGDFSSKNTAVDIKEQAKAMVTAAATLQGELIANESQLEGLKKIYTENNVRVRALRARIAELEAQLGKMGGKYTDPNDATDGSSGVSSGGSDSAGSNGDDSLYPSIRKLPVLGVAFADLYRRTKVQETVFEVLTQQYEMAKVAEAKEIPSVKVLDPSNVPERKSFPPRLLILIVGMGAGFGLGVCWIVGRARWSEVDERRASKALVRDISIGLRQYVAGTNGNSNPSSLKHALRARLRRTGSDQ